VFVKEEIEISVSVEAGSGKVETWIEVISDVIMNVLAGRVMLETRVSVILVVTVWTCGTVIPAWVIVVKTCSIEIDVNVDVTSGSVTISASKVLVSAGRAIVRTGKVSVEAGNWDVIVTRSVVTAVIVISLVSATAGSAMVDGGAKNVKVCWIVEIWARIVKVEVTAGSVTGMQDPASSVKVVSCSSRMLGQDAAGTFKIVPIRVSVEVLTGKVSVETSPGSVVETQAAPARVSVEVSTSKVNVVTSPGKVTVSAGSVVGMHDAPGKVTVSPESVVGTQEAPGKVTVLAGIFGPGRVIVVIWSGRHEGPSTASVVTFPGSVSVCAGNVMVLAGRREVKVSSPGVTETGTVNVTIWPGRHESPGTVNVVISPDNVTVLGGMFNPGNVNISMTVVICVWEFVSSTVTVWPGRVRVVVCQAEINGRHDAPGSVTVVSCPVEIDPGSVTVLAGEVTVVVCPPTIDLGRVTVEIELGNVNVEIARGNVNVEIDPSSVSVESEPGIVSVVNEVRISGTVCVVIVTPPIFRVVVTSCVVVMVVTLPSIVRVTQIPGNVIVCVEAAHVVWSLFVLVGLVCRVLVGVYGVDFTWVRVDLALVLVLVLVVVLVWVVRWYVNVLVIVLVLSRASTSILSPWSKWPFRFPKESFRNGNAETVKQKKHMKIRCGFNNAILQKRWVDGKPLPRRAWGLL
jgi:hypothetical protein